jgi:hypothetical protein
MTIENITKNVFKDYLHNKSFIKTGHQWKVEGQGRGENGE